MRAGRPWKLDARLGHVEPVVEVRVAGHQLLHLGVGAIDVLGIARQRGPAERADAAAEQRADVGRHEAREVEGVGHALVLGHLADVVAVVDGGDAAPVELEHGAHVLGHRALGGRASTPLGSAARRALPLGERPALREVAVDGIVRRGLVGHHVGAHAAADELGEDVGGVAEQADRQRFLLRAGALDHGQRLVERSGPACRGIWSCRRISMRLGWHSTASMEAPAITAASGCAPPMPPRPAVRIHLPARLPP